jgi:hypothetical protein
MGRWCADFGVVALVLDMKERYRPEERRVGQGGLGERKSSVQGRSQPWDGGYTNGVVPAANDQTEQRRNALTRRRACLAVERKHTPETRGATKPGWKRQQTRALDPLEVGGLGKSLWALVALRIEVPMR